MSLSLTRVACIPVWVIVLGLVAVSAPPMTMFTAVPLLVGATVVIPAVLLILALWMRPRCSWPGDVVHLWHTARRDRRSLVADADARDLMRMDSDMG